MTPEQIRDHCVAAFQNGFNAGFNLNRHHTANQGGKLVPGDGVRVAMDGSLVVGVHKLTFTSSDGCVVMTAEEIKL